MVFIRVFKLLRSECCRPQAEFKLNSSLFIFQFDHLTNSQCLTLLNKKVQKRFWPLNPAIGGLQNLLDLNLNLVWTLVCINNEPRLMDFDVLFYVMLLNILEEFKISVPFAKF